jgi:hypothetical protein
MVIVSIERGLPASQATAARVCMVDLFRLKGRDPSRAPARRKGRFRAGQGGGNRRRRLAFKPCVQTRRRGFGAVWSATGTLKDRRETMRKTLLAGAVLAALGLPFAAQAQSGAATGATTGAVGGAIVGGPVGAVVGGAAGAIVGGISDSQQPQFRQYVVTQGRPSYRYAEEVRVGATLPSSGVTYYEVPEQYGVRDYRYTIVNDTPVLVDPRSHRVVQIIR